MKLDIRKKVLLLVLSGILLTFLLLALFFTVGLYNASKTLNSEADALSSSASEYAEELVEKQIQKHMEEITRVRAQDMNREMVEAAEDTKYLADNMNNLLKKGIGSGADSLPNALYTDVPPGKPYIHYSPALVRQGVSPALQKEIDIESKIADSFVQMNEYYPIVFLGSRNGYTIRVKKSQNKPFLTEEPYRSSYDVRDRGWYKLGKEASGPVFTDTYVDTETGNPCISCVAPYYDTAGFAGVIGMDMDARAIYDEIMATDVTGASEQSVVIGRNGEIIASSKKDGVLSFTPDGRDLRKSGHTSFTRVVSAMVEGKTGVEVVSVDGTEYYLAYAPIKQTGWSFGTLVEKEATLAPAKEAAKGIREWTENFRGEMRGSLASYGTAMAAVMALLLVGGVSFSTWAARRFVKPILELQDGVKQIAQGNLDKTLDVKTGDEIEELADSVNNMSADLKTYIADLSQVTAEKERIATELSVATNIQKGMLPRLEPDFVGDSRFELFASMDPAKEVGGDFYDFYMLDERRLGITIADVSGKGVPAALFMAISKTILKSALMYVDGKTNLAGLVEKANRQICSNNEEMLFVTAFVGVLDLKTGIMNFVNCGHNPPLAFYKATDRFAYLPVKSGGVVLGIDEEASYREERLKLAPGDMLFLYTDGVTEAMDPDGRLFSEGRLKESLDRTGGAVAVREILETVRKDVGAFAGTAEQSDDITMVGLRYLG